MRKTTALLPYFGGNRTLARHVGALLEGCRFVVVPFAGGMPELLHIRANTIQVSDLNRHAINLANVLKDGVQGPALIRHLRRHIYHEDVLRHMQAVCQRVESGAVFDLSPIAWAESYFVCCWMGRNGCAGTGKEFTAGLSYRNDGDGGDSAVRFRSATEGLRAWRAVVPRCTFLVRDAFDILGRVKNAAGTGIYCDPPWPDDGDRYAHRFGEGKQRALADLLGGFDAARVVVRQGDHPLIRELYPEGARWRWLRLAGRTANRREMGAKAEVLIANFTPDPAAGAA